MILKDERFKIIDLYYISYLKVTLIGKHLSKKIFFYFYLGGSLLLTKVLYNTC